MENSFDLFHAHWKEWKPLETTAPAKPLTCFNPLLFTFLENGCGSIWFTLSGVQSWACHCRRLVWNCAHVQETFKQWTPSCQDPQKQHFYPHRGLAWRFTCIKLDIQRSKITLVSGNEYIFDLCCACRFCAWKPWWISNLTSAISSNTLVHLNCFTNEWWCLSGLIWTLTSTWWGRRLWHWMKSERSCNKYATTKDNNVVGWRSMAASFLSSLTMYSSLQGCHST